MSYLDDYTTFTEVDPNNKITINSSTQITTAADKIPAAYLYKDYGVGVFKGDLEHYLTAKTISNSAYNAWNVCWSLSNEIGAHLEVQEGIGVSVLPYSVDTKPNFCVFKIVGGVRTYSTKFQANHGVYYYLTVIRNGSTVTCNFYSDSNRTNLLGTRSITSAPTTNYRYIYAFQNQGVGATGFTFTMSTYNLKYKDYPSAYKISGTKNETARIIVLNESDWNIDSNTVVNGSGDYEIETIDTEIKTVIARNPDGCVKGYGNITPITE